MGRCFNGGGDPWDGFILDQINGQGQNDPGGNLVDQLLQGRGIPVNADHAGDTAGQQ